MAIGAPGQGGGRRGSGPAATTESPQAPADELALWRERGLASTDVAQDLHREFRRLETESLGCGDGGADAGSSRTSLARASSPASAWVGTGGHPVPKSPQVMSSLFSRRHRPLEWPITIHDLR